MEKIKIDPSVIKGKRTNLVLASFLESVKNILDDCNESEMVKLTMGELNSSGLKTLQSLRNYTGLKDFVPGHKVRMTLKNGDIFLYKIKI